ncbi:hypothetical protein PUMCH_001323 [Australozyma saopauloensis]|uniref:Uncharacterized protein n=1 Tax=Australozyma saopauloensis TaxID=291208 RepID=A0AAX4H6I7_9ASCO|nr:hypothetical protein PUMCH_001323 [[Candida] saopauloensis]
MSSAPTYSPLQAPLSQLGKRTHRHRRSGAISGNFDAVGLGLFSPPSIPNAARHSPHSLNPIPLSGSPGSHHHLLLSLMLYGSGGGSGEESDVLDRHFNFCNEEDFRNKPADTDFEFPKRISDLPALPFLSPAAIQSPLRRLSGGSTLLNSPIRLRNRRSASSMNATPKLFLTDETVMDEHNVPDALIDLDEILNPGNLLIGDRADSLNGAEPRSFHDDGFFQLSRPTYSLPLTCFSPFSSPAYLKQPIREPANRAIEEEDDSEIPAADLVPCAPSITFNTQRLNSLSAPATASTSEMYELSVNSSNTSLPSIETGSQRNASATLLEKSVSNSSRESTFSGPGFARSSSIKRASGAMASRYQTFYDQSIKISYALKNTSNENVNTPIPISTPNPASHEGLYYTPTSPHSLTFNSSIAENLGHSSSMPCLKVNGPTTGVPRHVGSSTGISEIRARDAKSIQVQQPVPNNHYGLYRPQDGHMRNSLGYIVHAELPYRINSKLGLYVETASLPVHSHYGNSSRQRERDDRKALAAQSSAKTSLTENSQSPSSLYSEGVSTVSTAGDHGTDHSSLASQPELMHGASKADRAMSRSVTPVIVVESVNATPLSYVDHEKPPPRVTTPVLRSTEQMKPAISNRSDEHISPTHKKILQSTQIPSYSPSRRKPRLSKKSEKPKTSSSSLSSRSSVLTEKNAGKEHKRTGSGHRLLSNWFRKCA